jgi:hypothetical protein
VETCASSKVFVYSRCKCLEIITISQPEHLHFSTQQFPSISLATPSSRELKTETEREIVESPRQHTQGSGSNLTPSPTFHPSTRHPSPVPILHPSRTNKPATNGPRPSHPQPQPLALFSPSLHPFRPLMLSCRLPAAGCSPFVLPLRFLLTLPGLILSPRCACCSAASAPPEGLIGERPLLRVDIDMTRSSAKTHARATPS